MQPPRPDERYQEFDFEEFEPDAAMLRGRLRAWSAAASEPLSDRAQKPEKLRELDASRNQIWRPLLRIADLAGGRWPELAREAALALSSGRDSDEAKSAGVRLLCHIRDVFGCERMTCGALAEALNAGQEMPYGGWRDGNESPPASLARSSARTGSRRTRSASTRPPPGPPERMRKGPRGTTATSSRTPGAGTFAQKASQKGDKRDNPHR
jgi:hypothetical protein